MRNISLLGSTGSIGCQTLEVIRRCPGDFVVSALSCGSNVDLIIRQAKEFHPQLISVASERDAILVREALTGLPIEVLSGNDGNIACATIADADMVVAAMVGVCGLAPVLAAIDAGKDIALANKETLVAGGSVVMPRVREKGVMLLPVDSEHSAIWQCLWGQPEASLERILITASGGPFRGWSREQLSNVTVEQALSHPTWKMGGKITIDSATMMNKGLEVIEAAWLFDVSVDQVTVVVHPQSIIHSMIRLCDGSVLAQMGKPNMMLPIEIALCYPERGPLLCDPFDPFDMSDLHFEPCDVATFPCLDYAIHAGRRGGSLPVVMNAANEIAVASFLRGEIAFTGIDRCVNACMEAEEKRGTSIPHSLDDILSLDRDTRRIATDFLANLRT